MSGEESVPEPYLPLWQIATLIVMTCFLTALGVAALARSPRYAANLLGNTGFYLFFAFFMAVALGAFFYQNRANLP